MNNSKGFQYSGTDNLEVMAEAVNYNTFIASMVNEHCQTAKHIVDFGAGIGTFTAYLHKQNKHVVAVEPDDTHRRHLSLLGIKNVINLNQVQDGWADAIYSLNVLEHIEDDDLILRQLCSKLNKSAKILIYVPAFQILYSSMDKKVGHFRRYSGAGLTEKMRKSGFEILDSRYVDSLGFLAALVYKYCGNREGDLNETTLKIYDRIVFPVSRFLDSLTSHLFGKNLLVIAKKNSNL